MFEYYFLPSEEKSDVAASKAPAESASAGSKAPVESDSESSKAPAKPASSEASSGPRTAIPPPVGGMPTPFDFSAMSGLLNVCAYNLFSHTTLNVCLLQLLFIQLNGG